MKGRKGNEKDKMKNEGRKRIVVLKRNKEKKKRF